jgi:hypothetical protein
VPTRKNSYTLHANISMSGDLLFEFRIRIPVFLCLGGVLVQRHSLIRKTGHTDIQSKKNDKREKKIQQQHEETSPHCPPTPTHVRLTQMVRPAKCEKKRGKERKRRGGGKAPTNDLANQKTCSQHSRRKTKKQDIDYSCGLGGVEMYFTKK